MSIEKNFTGPLRGQSRGEMPTARTDVEISACYVAIEKFSGTVEDKAGSFILRHFGVMSADQNRLISEIVSDSGTEELKGISGKTEIHRKGGEHQYVLHCEWD